MRYKKDIKVTATGLVIARVLDEDGNLKGSKLFTQFISTNSSIERSFKKAHKWADERIALCIKQEV